MVAGQCKMKMPEFLLHESCMFARCMLHVACDYGAKRLGVDRKLHVACCMLLQVQMRMSSISPRVDSGETFVIGLPVHAASVLRAERCVRVSAGGGAPKVCGVQT